MSSFEFSNEGFHELHRKALQLSAGEVAVSGMILRDREEQMQDAYLRVGIEPPTVTLIEYKKVANSAGKIVRVSLHEDGDPQIELGFCRTMPTASAPEEFSDAVMLEAEPKMRSVEDYDATTSLYDDLGESINNLVVTSHIG